MPIWPVSQKFCHPLWARFSKNYGANQQRLQISDLHFHKFTTWATFTISNGSNAIDQRSGDGWFSGWFNISVICKRIRMSDFEVLDTKIASALNRIIHHTSLKKKSVWRNKRPRSKTVSSEEDGSLTWSTSTSGSLESTILSRIVPTCSLLVFEMTIFRNSIQSGTKFYCLWRKSHLMTSWKDCTN